MSAAVAIAKAGRPRPAGHGLQPPLRAAPPVAPAAVARRPTTMLERNNRSGARTRVETETAANAKLLLA